MYGFSTIRLAASITRLTRVGAEAGAITRPSTSIAFSGGGGGGVKVAPPLGVWAPATGAATAAPTRQAKATRACSSVLGEREGILFRTPTGLADGLALKELARFLTQEVRPSGRSHLGSPAPRWSPGIRRGGEATRCIGERLTRFSAFSHASAEVLELLPRKAIGRRGAGPPESTRMSSHANSPDTPCDGRAERAQDRRRDRRCHAPHCAYAPGPMMDFAWLGLERLGAGERWAQRA